MFLVSMMTLSPKQFIGFRVRSVTGDVKIMMILQSQGTRYFRKVTIN